MENPATWNQCIRILNNSLNYGNDSMLTTDKVLSILINNNFLIPEDKNNQKIIDAIDKSIASHQYAIDNQCCGNSIGNIIYFNLKPLGVVE